LDNSKSLAIEITYLTILLPAGDKMCLDRCFVFFSAHLDFTHCLCIHAYIQIYLWL